MTLESIAELAGVSRSTVSRVINNHPHVRQEVRERVWKVIREQDFHPNSAARALVSRKTEIVGLVIPQAIQAVFSDPYFPILIQGIAAACNQHHYHLMLSLARGQQEDAYRRIIKGGHLDGVIMASALTDDTYFIDRLVEDEFPFVLIGRSPRHDHISFVDSDNFQGAAAAVQHLARAGHRKIATITGPLTMTAGVDRRDGFLSGLRATGLTPDADLIVEGDFTETSGYLAMQRLLALPTKPTAVFAASDSMAIGALKALHARGFAIPQDIALVGFDDIPLSSAVDPPLTTVRQSIEQLGFTAASLLLDRLRSPADKTPVQRVILPTELVVRDSCGHKLLFQQARLPLPASPKGGDS